MGLRQQTVVLRALGWSLAAGVACGCSADTRRELTPGPGVGSWHGAGAADDDAGDDAADDTEGDDGGESESGGTDGAGGSEDTGPALGDESGETSAGTAPDWSSGLECSNFDDAEDLLQWVNDQRAAYAGRGPVQAHDRWKGLPTRGESHDSFTFATRFAWDQGLADAARAEAERIVAGGNPRGTSIAGETALSRTHWIDGLNTAKWRITAAEYPGDFDGSSGAVQSRPWALDISNGSARMSLHYHDFGGDGPAINRVGIGAAIGDGCVVWWVLQFGH